MTITDGEIIGLTVVVVVLAVGTVIICVRCWRSINRASKLEKASEMHHMPERGFYVSSYVDNIRRSFRSLSQRGKSGTPTPVVIPRVHVATVEDLVAERSDMHPAYLQKHEKAVTGVKDTSPEQGLGDYHRLDESCDTGSLHGIENPMYTQTQPSDRDLQAQSTGPTGSPTRKDCSPVQLPCDIATRPRHQDLRSNDQTSRSCDPATKSDEGAVICVGDGGDSFCSAFYKTGSVSISPDSDPSIQPDSYI